MLAIQVPCQKRPSLLAWGGYGAEQVCRAPSQPKSHDVTILAGQILLLACPRTRQTPPQSHAGGGWGSLPILDLLDHLRACQPDLTGGRPHLTGPSRQEAGK